MPTKSPLWLALVVLGLFVTACRNFDDEVNSDNPFEEAENDPGSWSWIPVDGMDCRGFSGTGIGVRIQENTTKLLIYLEGGGACFNEFTCDNNPAAYGSNIFFGWTVAVGNSGIFSKVNSANPVRNWNAVYIPYCSGDLHGGNNPEVSGSGSRNFVGFNNVATALDLIAPYFSEVEEVLLTGSSAGGVGTFFNFPQVAEAFPGIPVHLINDSGPFLEADSALAPCLQQVWRDSFQLVLPNNCSGCAQANGDGLENLYSHLSTAYPDSRFGLICHLEDGVLRNFFGYGQEDCANLGGGFPQLPEGILSIGLTSLRDNRLVPAGNWSTFYLEGTDHVTISNSKYYDSSAGGKAIAEWVDDLLGGVVQQLEE
ncbi:MAG: hypothetical protein KDC44_20900 [Phaeodactylibacter sp.]|nr:hypothetical protein [Phaeodactylibacter sp.]